MPDKSSSVGGHCRGRTSGRERGRDRHIMTFREYCIVTSWIVERGNRLQIQAWRPRVWDWLQPPAVVAPPLYSTEQNNYFVFFLWPPFRSTLSFNTVLRNRVSFYRHAILFIALCLLLEYVHLFDTITDYRIQQTNTSVHSAAGDGSWRHCCF